MSNIDDINEDLFGAIEHIIRNYDEGHRLSMIETTILRILMLDYIEKVIDDRNDALALETKEG